MIKEKRKVLGIITHTKKNRQRNHNSRIKINHAATKIKSTIPYTMPSQTKKTTRNEYTKP
jgi:hypothetical protein